MDVRKAIHEIIGMCKEAQEQGEPLPVDVRLLTELTRHEARHCGLPHPLSGFGLLGFVDYGPEADLLLDAVNDLIFEPSGSVRKQSAAWLLFENESYYREICSRAEVDADRLRNCLQERVPRQWLKGRQTPNI